jgi:prepilin-type N-terminal cleavage/methylation domain-containing protein
MKTRGFTLVELLVVIAVIAILAGLLLPALTSAKRSGQGAYCLNNLKQLQLGWQLYTDDFHQNVPPITDTVMAGKDAAHPSWVAGWLKTDSDQGDKSDSTNTDLLIGPQYAPFGSIGQYVKQAQVYRCPADKSTVTIGGRPYPRVRSMSMNAYLWGTGKWQAPAFVVFKKTVEIHNPSQIWVFIDEREDSINDGAFGVDMTRQYAIVDYPASYHNGAGGMAFSDGHSEYHLWREKTTTPILQAGVRLPRGSKFTSENDVDMQWLTAHTTVPKGG